MSGEDQSLMDRIEVPRVPKNAQKKVNHLQEEFFRAEVEQRMSKSLSFHPSASVPRRVTHYDERGICTMSRSYGEEKEEEEAMLIAPPR